MKKECEREAREQRKNTKKPCTNFTFAENPGFLAVHKPGPSEVEISSVESSGPSNYDCSSWDLSDSIVDDVAA